MRLFTIRSGTYEGLHKIYESDAEAERDGKTVVTPWYRSKTGDWVRTDDGFVMQVLKMYTLVNKRHKSGQRTECFRFCNGTFPVYYNKDGKTNEKHIKNLYGAKLVSTRNNNSLSNRNPNDRIWLARVKAGEDPWAAYYKAFNKGRRQPTNIVYSRVSNLVNRYRNRIMEEVSTTIKRIEEKVRKLTKTDENPDGVSVDELMADKIAGMLVKDSKSKEIRENLKMYMSMKNIYQKPGKNAREVPYEEEKPPLLKEMKPQIWDKEKSKNKEPDKSSDTASKDDSWEGDTK